jgi:DNA-directed RNA polymerase sigma subunit (sigma70/sigma32)
VKFESATLERIGATLGATRERARQLKERALLRLRRSPQTGELLAFQRA